MMRSYKNHSSGFYEGNPNNGKMSSSTSSECRSPPPLVTEVVTIDSDSNDGEQMGYNNNNEESSPDRHRLRDSEDTEKRESDDDVIVIEDESDSIEKLSWIKTTGDTLDPRHKVSAKDFEILKLLGTGAYGKVWQVKKLNGPDKGKLYAMKVLEKVKVMHKKKTTEHTRTEREVLEQIVDCTFLATMYYAFQTAEKLYLVLEFVQGGELFTHLYKSECFTEDQTRFYIAEIIVAIEQLHKKNVIYRDIKLENILLDAKGHIVITDFGLSKELTGDNRAHSFCGTIEYMAPEIVSQDSKGHGLIVDWWSVGVLIIELLTGQSPFSRENEESNQNLISERIKNDPPLIPEKIGKDARDLILKLLEKEPTKRLGSKNDAKELKQHRFFEKIDWRKLEAKECKVPFVPLLSGNDDVSQFSEDFTKQKPEDAPAAKPTQKNADRYFKRYSYVAPNLRWRFNDQAETKVQVDRTEPERPVLSKVLKFLNQEDGNFSRKYRIEPNERQIGDGTYSICVRCIRKKDGQEFAVKIMNLLHDSSAEIKTLGRCQGHENIVQMVESLEDTKYKYIVFELLTGGELFSRIQQYGGFNEKTARPYFEQLVQAVKFMHSKDIVHRDLKPENIMFSDARENSTLKIVDFGFARLRTAEETVACFTLDYAAPESLTKGTIKESRDLWSLGVILYTMLCGTTPFSQPGLPGQNRDIVSEKIKAGDFNRGEAWEKLSQNAQNLIESLLKVDPGSRLLLKNVEEHPWLRFSEHIIAELIVIDDESMDAPSAKNREENVSNDSSGIVLSEENARSSYSSNVHALSEEVEPDDDQLEGEIAVDSKGASNEENNVHLLRYSSELQMSEMKENLNSTIPRDFDGLEKQQYQNSEGKSDVLEHNDNDKVRPTKTKKIRRSTDVMSDNEQEPENCESNVIAEIAGSHFDSWAHHEPEKLVREKKRRGRKPKTQKIQTQIEESKAKHIEDENIIFANPSLVVSEEKIIKRRGRTPKMKPQLVDSSTETVIEQATDTTVKKHRRGRKPKISSTSHISDITSPIAEKEVIIQRRHRKLTENAKLDQNSLLHESVNIDPSQPMKLLKTRRGRKNKFCKNDDYLESNKTFELIADVSRSPFLGFSIENSFNSYDLKFWHSCLFQEPELIPIDEGQINKRASLRARNPETKYKFTRKRAVRQNATDIADKLQTNRFQNVIKCEKKQKPLIEVLNSPKRVAKRKSEVQPIQSEPKRQRRRRKEVDAVPIKNKQPLRSARNLKNSIKQEPKPCKTVREVQQQVAEFEHENYLQKPLHNNERPSMIMVRHSYLPQLTQLQTKGSEDKRDNLI